MTYLLLIDLLQFMLTLYFAYATFTKASQASSGTSNAPPSLLAPFWSTSASTTPKASTSVAPLPICSATGSENALVYRGYARHRHMRKQMSTDARGSADDCAYDSVVASAAPINPKRTVHTTPMTQGCKGTREGGGG